MYETELDFLKKVLVSASKKYCKMPFTVSEKGAFDVVTDIDRTIENYFTQELKKRFPKDRLHGEEFSSTAELSDRTWIIDPIDGTYNFSTHSPLYGLQAALWDRGETKISVIYLPEFDQMYTAKKGCGAFCNDKPIRVSSRDTKDAIVSFGDFSHRIATDATDQMKIVNNSYEKITRCRMFGCAGVDFAYVACGITEGTLLFTKNKWDIAPGLLILQEAGGCAFDLDGNDYTFDSRAIFAVNKKSLFDDMMEGVVI